MEQYTYIQINTPGYIEFNTKLDPESFEIGTTWDDYLADKWVLLSPDQLAFRDKHPDASVQEIFEMKLVDNPKPEPAPEPEPLQDARRAKLAEIKAQDEFSNKFFVSVISGGVEVKNVELWIDSGLRTTLLNTTLPALLSDNETWTILWTEEVPRKEISVPIAWAMKYIPYLEIYAKRTYDQTARNQNAVDAATTIEELAEIDVKADYPLFLTFELNLDNYASNTTETIS